MTSITDLSKAALVTPPIPQRASPPLPTSLDVVVTYNQAPSSTPLSKLEETETLRKALQLTDGEKSLWEHLDEARQTVHPLAVKNLFLKRVMKGEFCETEYTHYLSVLLIIHQALEDAQEKLLRHKHLKNVVNKALFRTSAIQDDLVIWKSISNAGSTPEKPHKLANKLAEHIGDLSENDPEKILSIMYVLYGTIMSGGQMSKRGVEKKLKNVKEYTEHVPEGSGTALFEISGILNDAQLATFKQNLHLQLSNTKCDPTKLKPEVPNVINKTLEIIDSIVESRNC